MKYLLLFFISFCFINGLLAQDQCPSFSIGATINFENCRVVENTNSDAGFVETLSILRESELTFHIIFTGGLDNTIILTADGKWHKISDTRKRLVWCQDKKLSKIEQFISNNNNEKYFSRSYSLNSASQLIIEENYGNVEGSSGIFKVKGRSRIVCDKKR